MPHHHHLVIPFAASLAWLDALHHLPALPHTTRWLQRHRTTARDEGDAHTLNTPHERVCAHSLGWPLADGLLPFAAQGQNDPCGWLTPVHWHAGSDRVTLAPPAELQLPDADALTLCTALQPLFDADWRLEPARSTRWRLHHPSLAHVPTASLDRAAGRSITPWLDADASPPALRRLLAEVQMLLHAHPLNTAREAAGLLPVNAVWLSGTGAPQPATGSQPTLNTCLQDPALAGDLPGWLAAWAQLDAGPVAELPDDAALTLCGERSAITLAGPPRSAWRRWLSPRPTLPALLATL